MVGPISLSYPLMMSGTIPTAFPVVFSYLKKKKVQSSLLLFKTLIFNLTVISFPSNSDLAHGPRKFNQGRGIVWSFGGGEDNEGINCLNMWPLLQSSVVATTALANTDYDTGSQMMVFLLGTGRSSLVTEGWEALIQLSISLPEICFSSTSSAFAPLSNRANPVKMAKAWLPSTLLTWTEIQDEYRLFRGYPLCPHWGFCPLFFIPYSSRHR